MSDLVTSENVRFLREAFEKHDNCELTLAEFMNVMDRVVFRQRDCIRRVTQEMQARGTNRRSRCVMVHIHERYLGHNLACCTS